jgi:hypothetical protein
LDRSTEEKRHGRRQISRAYGDWNGQEKEEKKKKKKKKKERVHLEKTMRAKRM